MCDFEWVRACERFERNLLLSLRSRVNKKRISRNVNCPNDLLSIWIQQRVARANRLALANGMCIRLPRKRVEESWTRNNVHTGKKTAIRWAIFLKNEFHNYSISGNSTHWIVYSNCGMLIKIQNHADVLIICVFYHKFEIKCLFFRIKFGNLYRRFISSSFHIFHFF